MRSVTTLLPEMETAGSRRPKLAYVESKLCGLDPDIRSVFVLKDTFVVNDLLENYSYVIAGSGSGYQLTFMLKDGRQVVVAVEPTGNPALVAQKIAQRLTELGNHLVRFNLGRAIERYGRCMLN